MHDSILLYVSRRHGVSSLPRLTLHPVPRHFLPDSCHRLSDPTTMAAHVCHRFVERVHRQMASTAPIYRDRLNWARLQLMGVCSPTLAVRRTGAWRRPPIRRYVAAQATGQRWRDQRAWCTRRRTAGRHGGEPTGVPRGSGAGTGVTGHARAGRSRGGRRSSAHRQATARRRGRCRAHAGDA